MFVVKTLEKEMAYLRHFSFFKKLSTETVLPGQIPQIHPVVLSGYPYQTLPTEQVPLEFLPRNAHTETKM